MTPTTKRWLFGLFIALVAVAGAAVVLPRFYSARRAQQVAELATKARERLASGETSEAAKLFATYLRQAPNDTAAQAQYAAALAAPAFKPGSTEEQRQEVVDAIRTAIAIHPKSLPLRRSLAVVLLEMRSFESARREIGLLRTAAAAIPATALAASGIDLDEISLLEARACLANNNLPEATALAAGLAGFDPTGKTFDPQRKVGRYGADASLILATILADKQQDLPAAQQVLKQLEETAPQDRLAWLGQARWYAGHSDPTRAEQSINRALEIAPQDRELLTTAVAIAKANRRWDEATRRAGELREQFPTSPDGDMSLAEVALEQGKPLEALEVLQQAAVRLPENPVVLFSLGNIQIETKRLTDAEETIARLSKNGGRTNPAIELLAARLLVAQQQWQPAVEKLEALRLVLGESAPLRKQVNFLLAECHGRMGKVDLQVEARQRALDHNPGSPEARASAAVGLAAAGKPEEALAEFEAIATELGPEQLVRQPQVWQPLLQLRANQQLKLPAENRDWSQVVSLIDAVEAAQIMPAWQVALLRHDQFLTAGDPTAASALLDRMIDAHAAQSEFWDRLLTSTLRREGPAAALQLWSRVPPETAADPRLLVWRARVAARMPGDERSAVLADIEAKAAALSPEDASRLLATVATSRLTSGDQPGAEHSLELLLAAKPDDLPAHTILFELACDQRDLPKATSAAAEIARICGPDSAQARATEAAKLLLAVSLRRNPATPTNTAQTPAAAQAPEDDSAQLTAAENLLAGAEKERPDWPVVQRLWADLELLRGDRAAAIQRLQKGLELSPDNAPFTRNVVMLLAQAGRHDEAREALKRLGAEVPAGFARLAAEVEFGAGRADAATALAERIIASNEPLSPDDMLWFGQLLAKAGRSAPAIQALERLVVQNAASLPGWLSLLSCQLESGDREAAERTLARMGEQLSPPARPLGMARGQTLLGRPEDAEATLREAVASFPDEINLRFGLAEWLAGRGRATEACGVLQDFLATSDGGAAAEGARKAARRAIADLTSRSGTSRDFEQALAQFAPHTDAAEKLSSDDLTFEISALSTRAEPKYWRLALETLAQLSAQRPLTTAERMQRAELLDKTGRWEECRDDLLRLAAEPATPSAMLGATIEKLIRHGATDDAAIVWKTLAERDPKTPAVYALEAQLAVAQGDQPAAIEALRKLYAVAAKQADNQDQLLKVVALMEKLGFDQAADKTLAAVADKSSTGMLARAGFLARHDRATEAFDLLDANRESLAPEQFVRAAVSLLKEAGTAATTADADRVNQWFAAARQADPDGHELSMLEAELLTALNRNPDAVAAYRKMLAQEKLSTSQQVILKNNLAMLLARPETAAEAQRLAEEAIAEVGAVPSLLDTQGLALLARGDSHAAVEVLREAVLAPSPAISLHLACALAADKDLEGARQALLEARKVGLVENRLEPDDRERMKALEAILAAPPAGS